MKNRLTRSNTFKRLSPRYGALSAYEGGYSRVPSLKGLVSDRETLVLKLTDTGERLEIIYKPSRLSAAYIEQWATELERLRRENATDDEAVHVYAEMLANIVLEWDVTGELPDEDVPGFPRGSVVGIDEVVPLTVEALKWLSSPVLLFLIDEIREDARLKVRRRTGSRTRS